MDQKRRPAKGHRQMKVTRSFFMLGLGLLAGQATAACVADGPLATARWIYGHQRDFVVFVTSQDKTVMQSFLSPSLFELL